MDTIDWEKETMEDLYKRGNLGECPKITSHYGTCEYCGKKHVMILHFGYNKEPKRGYCICENCLRENEIIQEEEEQEWQQKEE